jgi:hypothetical protein
MRTMARAVVLLLVVAFVAGVWDSRYEQERQPAGSPAPFRTEPVERSRRSRSTPEVVSVQTVEKEGYDRVLFTFEGPMPGYQVRYVSRVTDAAGERLPLRGQAFLAVAFQPARAHVPDGEATFPTAAITPGYPALRQVRFAGDFEGQVAFGIGVADRGGFRVSELRDPTRVVVDVR